MKMNVKITNTDSNRPVYSSRIHVKGTSYYNINIIGRTVGGAILQPGHYIFEAQVLQVPAKLKPYPASIQIYVERR